MAKIDSHNCLHGDNKRRKKGAKKSVARMRMMGEEEEEEVQCERNSMSERGAESE